MKIVPGGNIPQISDRQNTADFSVKARVSPGLFFVSIGGKSLYARTTLDLVPGQLYHGRLDDIGGHKVIQLQAGSDVKTIDLLDAYRQESTVPLDQFSRLMMQSWFNLERGFDAAEFRRIYYQFIWLTSRLFPGREAAEGLVGGSAGEVELPAEAATVLRLLIMISDKGLEWSDHQLLQFFRGMGIGDRQKNRRASADGAPREAHEGSGNDAEQPFDDGLFMGQLGEFNGQSGSRETRGRNSSDERGWIILPLEDRDHPGERAFLRYNIFNARAGVSCKIEEWTFFWYPEHGRVMYYSITDSSPNEDSREERTGKSISKKLQSRHAEELLDHLKIVKFQRVVEMFEIPGFDGFSLTDSARSIQLREMPSEEYQEGADAEEAQ